MAYRDLSLQERHAVIKECVANGIHRLSDIEAAYNAAQQPANEFAEGGSIHIAPSKRGTFTAAATKHGKSVQAFASQVLAHKENYSPAMVRKANFARNSAHWHDGESDTQYLNTEVYEPWFPDKHKEDYGFSIGQWLGPMHVREMQLGSARNHSEASSYLVDSNKEFVNDYISRLSAAHPELSSTALSDIKASLSPESISFVPDDSFAKSNSAGETVAHREGNKIIPEIRLRDNIGYYDTPNKYRDLSNIFRHEMNHFLRKYQGNYTDSIFNQDERGILNSAYFAVPSTLERAAENARLRSIISQNHDNVWGKELDDVIDNLSYEDLLSYISNMEGYMKDSEPLYTAPDKEAVAGLQSKIAEKDKERDAILNTVIYPKYLIPYEDGTYIKDNIINKYKTIEGEDASGVRDAMFKEWDENTDLKRVDSERKALEEELKKVLMAPNKERLDAVKTALKQVAQNNSGFHKSDNTYLAAFGGHLVHQHGFGDWLNRVFGSQENIQTADTIPQEPLTQGLDYKELRQRQAYTESKFDNDATYVSTQIPIEPIEITYLDPEDNSLKVYNDLSEKGKAVAHTTMLYEEDKPLEIVSPEFDLLTLGRSIFTSPLLGTPIKVNPGEYFRVVGKDAVVDAQKSGIVRPPVVGRLDMKDIPRVSKLSGISESKLVKMTSEEQKAVLQAIRENPKISNTDKLIRFKSNHGDVGFEKEGFFYYPKRTANTAVIKGTEHKSTFLGGHHGSYTGLINNQIYPESPVVLRGGNSVYNFTKWTPALLGGWRETPLVESSLLTGIKDAIHVLPPTVGGLIYQDKYSTGGPLYPFSFSKKPLPPVRY